MDYGRSTRADALAAGYVAGTLRGGARRRFESLLPGHPALRAAVAEWQARLMPLTVALQPVQPTAALWQGIQQRLWPAPAAAPWWQRLGLWRGAATLATVAAVGLAVLVAARRRPRRRWWWCCKARAEIQPSLAAWWPASAATAVRWLPARSRPWL
jgi:anti-sigma-K factor RskA